MQRFLVSVILATVGSWMLLVFFASKTKGVNLLQDLVFILLLFLAVSFTLSLFFYFSRIIISKLGNKKKLKYEEKEFVNMRPIFRRSFKMAGVIAAFLALVAFLKLEQLLNLFNFSLLVTIIFLGAILLKR